MPRHIATYRTPAGADITITRNPWPFANYTATCAGCGSTLRERFKQPTEHAAAQATTQWATTHAETCRRVN